VHIAFVVHFAQMIFLFQRNCGGGVTTSVEGSSNFVLLLAGHHNRIVTSLLFPREGSVELRSRPSDFNN
jgi:hypothetical protein